MSEPKRVSKKRQKNKPITLQELQNIGNSIVETEPISPAEFYNKFLRKEGRPILTDEQYKQLLKTEQDAINRNRPTD